MDDTNEERWDLYATPEGHTLKTHGPATCKPPCSLHAPSDHHMVGWPLTFDHTRLWLGQRTCEHELVHPDPDSVTYLGQRLPSMLVAKLTQHECDDCCVLASEPDAEFDDEAGVATVILTGVTGYQEWVVKCTPDVLKLTVRLPLGTALEIIGTDEG